MASWPASGLSTSSSAPGRGACSWGFLFGLGLPAVQPGQTTRELHHAERGESDGRGQDADSGGRSWRGWGGEGNGVGDLAAGRPGAGRVASAEHGMDGELHSCALGSRTVALTSVTPVHSVEVKKLQTEESGVSNATLEGQSRAHTRVRRCAQEAGASASVHAARAPRQNGLTTGCSLRRRPPTVPPTGTGHSLGVPPLQAIACRVKRQAPSREHGGQSAGAPGVRSAQLDSSPAGGDERERLRRSLSRGGAQPHPRPGA